MKTWFKTLIFYMLMLWLVGDASRRLSSKHQMQLPSMYPSPPTQSNCWFHAMKGVNKNGCWIHNQEHIKHANDVIMIHPSPLTFVYFKTTSNNYSNQFPLPNKKHRPPKPSPLLHRRINPTFSLVDQRISCASASAKGSVFNSPTSGNMREIPWSMGLNQCLAGAVELVKNFRDMHKTCCAWGIF